MKSEKKKSLMPTPAKKSGARLPLETPKGSRESVPPSGPSVAVPLVTVDADAGCPLLTREAGAALVYLSADGRDEEVTGLMMDVRNRLAVQVYEALGSPEGEVASVLTDLSVRHVVSSLTAEAVLVLVQSHPELVLEAARLVAASRPAEV